MEEEEKGGQERKGKVGSEISEGDRAPSIMAVVCHCCHCCLVISTVWRYYLLPFGSAQMAIRAHEREKRASDTLSLLSSIAAASTAAHSAAKHVNYGCCLYLLCIHSFIQHSAKRPSLFLLITVNLSRCLLLYECRPLPAIVLVCCLLPLLIRRPAVHRHTHTDTALTAFNLIRRRRRM